jgi:cell fate regulator YaaT (PSP1 superfamily)
MQKATLDPAKISGYCGRLKCCLRYEDQTYNELKKKLPKKGTKVRTSQGEGKVIDTQILTQLVMVEYENGDREAIGVDMIEIVKASSEKRDRQNNNKKNNEQNNQPESMDSDEQ